MAHLGILNEQQNLEIHFEPWATGRQPVERGQEDVGNKCVNRMFTRIHKFHVCENIISKAGLKNMI